MGQSHSLMVATSQSSSCSPSLPADYALVPYRTSAEIVEPDFPQAFRMPPDMGRIYARMIEATFPAPSRHAVCVKAAQALGTSVDTIERMVAGMTVRADARLILQCLVIYQHRRKVPFQIAPGLAAKLIEAQA